MQGKREIADKKYDQAYKNFQDIFKLGNPEMNLYCRLKLALHMRELNSIDKEILKIRRQKRTDRL